MPVQPSICHNTAEPTVCLLSLLYATIQPSLLCACSAFYVPQYSRAYFVLAQPSIYHNTAEPIVCLLSLLYATIQYKYCNIIFPQPAYLYCNTIPATHCNTIFSTAHLYIAIQFPSQQASQNLLCHNTMSHCIVTQLGSSTTVSAPLFEQNFFFLLSNWKITQKHIHIFFFSSCYWTGKQQKKFYIHFFSSFSNTPK